MSGERSPWSFAAGETKPLTIEDLRRGFDAIHDREERIEETRRAWGEAYRAMSDEDRKVVDAEHQAIMELTGQEPDPARPIIVSPETAERIEARVCEILSNE